MSSHRASRPSLQLLCCCCCNDETCARTCTGRAELQLPESGSAKAQTLHFRLAPSKLHDQQLFAFLRARQLSKSDEQQRVAIARASNGSHLAFIWSNCQLLAFCSLVAFANPNPNPKPNSNPDSNSNSTRVRRVRLAPAQSKRVQVAPLPSKVGAQNTCSHS